MTAVLYILAAIGACTVAYWTPATVRFFRDFWKPAGQGAPFWAVYRRGMTSKGGR